MRTDLKMGKGKMAAQVIEFLEQQTRHFNTDNDIL